MPESFTTTSQGSEGITEEEVSSGIRPDGDAAENFSRVDVPFSLYSDVNRNSYTEDFFGLNLSMPEDVRNIEDFVLKEIGKRGFEDTTDSYKEIISEVLNKLSISGNELPHIKIGKISKYISMIRKNKSTNQKKRDLIKRKDNSLNKFKSQL